MHAATEAEEAAAERIHRLVVTGVRLKVADGDAELGSSNRISSPVRTHHYPSALVIGDGCHVICRILSARKDEP